MADCLKLSIGGYYMRIFIDSDACPVIEEIMRVTQENQVNSYFVSTANQFFVVKDSPIYYHWVLVDDKEDTVDSFIAKYVEAGDVVITQNYELALSVINKGVKVITNRGRYINDDNIDFLLFMKRIRTRIINAGRKYECFSAMECEDRDLFSVKLIELINCIKKEGNLF